MLRTRCGTAREQALRKRYSQAWPSKVARPEGPITRIKYGRKVYIDTDACERSSGRLSSAKRSLVAAITRSWCERWQPSEALDHATFLIDE